MRIWGISVNTFFCHSFVLRKGERLGLWRNWRGGQGVTDEGGKGFPWKAKCKNWAPFTLYFDITTLLVFSRLIFASLVLFSDNFGFQYRQPYADSLSLLHFFFPSVVSGPRSANFLPPGSNLYFRHWLRNTLKTQWACSLCKERDSLE